MLSILFRRWQCAVQKAFALAIQCDGMMRPLANVDTDEDLDAVMLLNIGHAFSKGFTTMGQRTTATDLGIHVTGELRLLRIQPLSAIISRLPGPVTTPPGSWTTGGRNHAGPSWPTPAYPGVANKVTGASSSPSSCTGLHYFFSATFGGIRQQRDCLLISGLGQARRNP